MFSKFSVKKPYTVFVGVIMVIVLGVVSFMKMSTDLLPNINLPYVIVMTTYPGASPETVEMVVTKPVESAMATVSNIEDITSVSAENYSMVIMEFAQSANMDSISLEIRESLDQIKSYWDDSVGNPIIMKLNPDMLPVMIAAVGVEGMTNAEVSEYTEENVIPRLESIEGVASASATGLIDENVNVIIRQEKIDAINEQVFGSIDADLAEAQEEIDDGYAEIADGEKELADSVEDIKENEQDLAEGRQEIEDAKKELADAKYDLASGKAELAEKQEELEEQKEELEEGKEEAISEITKAVEEINTQKRKLDEAVKMVEAQGVTDSNVDSKIEETTKGIETLTQTEAAIPQLKAALEAKTAELESAQTELEGAQTALEALQEEYSGIDADNYTEFAGGLNVTIIENPADETEVAVNVDAVKAAYETEKIVPAQTVVTEKTEAVTNATEGVTDAATAVKTAEATVANLPAQIETAQAWLVALETYKGREAVYAQIEAGMGQLSAAQIEAAAGFGTADAAIIFGEAQMKSAEAQMESAEEQIESGEEQLEASEEQLATGQEQIDAAYEQIEDAKEQMEEAKDQLADAQEQLDDSRDMAYSNADMNGILTVETVKSLLTAQNFSMPAGYVTEDGTEYLIRVGDKPDDVEKLKAMPLLNMNMDGVDVITLGDVADVFMTDNSSEIYTNLNGTPGIMISMQKQTGYSTGDVSDSIKEEFEQMLEEDERLELIKLMDQGIYIDMVMDSIISNIVWGALLAIIILMLFLKDVRPTLVIAVSIPVSLVAAIVCMYFSGVTLNIISLSGLALGIGMLVDNSIVVIENIYRLRNEGASMKEAAIEGAREVAGAIVASTLTTVCVFAPIVFTEGITRQLFVDMGLTIAYSLLASLVIALTVVPALASKVLKTVKESKESGIFNSLSRIYEKSIGWALKYKVVVLFGVVVLLVVSAWLSISKGIAFMPSMDSTEISITMEMPIGTKLEDTAEVSDEIVSRIQQIEDVQDVGAMMGGNSLMGTDTSTNVVSMYIVLKEEKTHSAVEVGKMIEEATADIENAELTITTDSMDMSALSGSGISIQVRGRDLDTLQQIATDVASIIEGVEGTVDVSDGQEETTGELRVLIDRDKAMDCGLTVAQVFQQINEKLAEDTGSTQLVTDTKEYDILVIHQGNEDLSRNDIRNLAIDYTDKDDKKCKISLSEIAKFEEHEGLKSINRTSQTRYVTVSAGIAEGHNIGIVAADVEEVLKDYELPSGYSLVFEGENEMILDAMEQLMLMMLLAIIFMFLIMVAQFQSLLSPFIILFTIPLAFTGGFMGLYMTGSEVSVIALIGFVMLAGIIVNNGIVLVDYINMLRENGMEKKEAIMTAGRTRLRPVLMTALTTILAMSTMMFSHDMGADLSKPMAIVIIGGLTYGTLLTLYVVPCIYDIFNREKKVKIEE